jgi:hypothetical protein
MATKRKKKYRRKKSKSKTNDDSKSKTRKIKQLNCRPGTNHDFTCYSSQSLNKMRDLWNERHPDTKIASNNPREIWSSFKNNLSNVCDTEKCWLNQSFMNNKLDSELLNYTFAPNAPKIWKKNPNEWLNSLDINNVMKQYEYTYPSFTFIGPSPIDFNKKKMFGQCVWNELCNFDLESLIKKGKTKIGIIFNTDPHYLEGSHWICMFIDINNKYIYYFDSNADETPREILKLVDNIKNQADKLGIKMKYNRNNMEHQKSDTECGMYVLYVITQLLEHKMTPEMFKKRVPDSEMEKLRKVFFN